MFLRNDLALTWRDRFGTKCLLHIKDDVDPRSTREDTDCLATTMACFHRRYDLGDRGIPQSAEEFWQDLVAKYIPYEEITNKAFAGEIPNVTVSEDCRGFYVVSIYGEVFYSEIDRKEDVGIYVTGEMDIPQCMTLLTPYAVWKSLYLYDHSGLSISASTSSNPYSDSWDSGILGWIVCEKARLQELRGDIDDNDWQSIAEKEIDTDVMLYDAYLHNEIYGYDLYVDRDGEWELENTCLGGFYGDDPVESGLAGDVGHDLEMAISSNSILEGIAKEKRTVSYSFEFAAS